MNWGDLGFGDAAVFFDDFVDDVRLVELTSIGDGGISSCHLEWRCGKTLSERMGDQFTIGPLVKV